MGIQKWLRSSTLSFACADIVSGMAHRIVNIFFIFSFVFVFYLFTLPMLSEFLP